MKNHSFVPDMMFDRAFDITPALLISKGIRAVVLDIDNTLQSSRDYQQDVNQASFG